MKENGTIWNGYPVIGDTKELDHIVEHSGLISLDIKDILSTLSDSGEHHITVATGPGTSETLSDALSNLPAPLGSIDKMLIQIYFGTQQLLMSDLSAIPTQLRDTNRDMSVVWGVSQDESLGDKIKIVLLTSLRK